MKRRSDVTFLPRRTSITSSVGTRTSSICVSSPCSVMAVRICSATRFSKLDSTLTEYHRFAMSEPPASRSCRIAEPPDGPQHTRRDL